MCRQNPTPRGVEFTGNEGGGGVTFRGNQDQQIVRSRHQDMTDTLAECRACNRKLSPKAKVCPDCGQPDPVMIKKITIRDLTEGDGHFLGGIVGGVIGGLISWINREDATYRSTGTLVGVGALCGRMAGAFIVNCVQRHFAKHNNTNSAINPSEFDQP